MSYVAEYAVSINSYDVLLKFCRHVCFISYNENINTLFRNLRTS